MKKISIIIPIYNAEKYICRCIESVINQTYKNIEILLINDGSSDKTQNIIENYKKYENIIIINKVNSGVSDTRNLGLQRASGDFVMFVDADDYIDSDYIEKMINVANDYDLIISGYKEIKDNNIEYKSIYKKSIIKNKTIDITFPKKKSDYFSTIEFNPCWKMLISMSLIKNNKINFNSDIKYGEDMLFSLFCYIFSKKTIYLLNFGYNYCINDYSAMNKMSLEHIKKYYEDNLKVYEIITDDLNLDKHDLELLTYKILQVFKGITGKLIESSLDYKNYIVVYKKIRKKYNMVFEKYNYKWKYGIEGVLIYLLKLKFNYIYFKLKNEVI